MNFIYSLRGRNPKALDKAYKAVDAITFEKAHHRNDIGQRALRAL